MKKTIYLTGLILAGIFIFLNSLAGSPAQNPDDMVKLFLDSINKSFATNAAQSQSITQIILAFQIHGDRDLRKLAYILATAWHESKFTLVKEKRGTPGTDLYNTQEKYWNTGFYGRGFVQLTHRENYEKMGKILGIDLVNNPDLALNRAYAADILVIGMIKGVFTGKALFHYIDVLPDYVNARRVVNGLDRADLIAGYTKKIIENLEYPIV